MVGDASKEKIMMTILIIFLEVGMLITYFSFRKPIQFLKTGQHKIYRSFV
jgi:hypothetical protein